MTELEKEIKRLRRTKMSYEEISSQLGCSKGTISYFLGAGQKEKNRLRQRKTRKEDSLVYKRDAFTRACAVWSKKENKTLKTKKDTFNKTEGGYRRHRLPKSLFTMEELKAKLSKTKPVCYLSGKSINFSDPSTFSFDHIIPVSKGGRPTLENLGITTKQANRAKSDMAVDEFIKLCKDVLEYNGFKVTTED